MADMIKKKSLSFFLTHKKKIIITYLFISVSQVSMLIISTLPATLVAVKRKKKLKELKIKVIVTVISATDKPE